MPDDEIAATLLGRALTSEFCCSRLGQSWRRLRPGSFSTSFHTFSHHIWAISFLFRDSVVRRRALGGDAGIIFLRDHNKLWPGTFDWHQLPKTINMQSSVALTFPIMNQTPVTLRTFHLQTNLAVLVQTESYFNCVRNRQNNVCWPPDKEIIHVFD